MPATAQFQLQLTYPQVAQLVRQRPAEYKQKLTRLLTDSSFSEKFEGDF